MVRRNEGSQMYSAALILYLTAVVIVTAVNDGWSGRPDPLMHQLLLLPFLGVLGWSVAGLLGKTAAHVHERLRTSSVVTVLAGACVAFELLFGPELLYERHHFARFGYVLPEAIATICCLAIVLGAAAAFWRPTGKRTLIAVLWVYGAGLLLAIRCFPLNYLRSDMLPVIVWADQRLLAGLDPYATMHVGGRLYDFPYLPGMLLAFLPAVAAHVDVRFVCLGCVLTLSVLIYAGASEYRRVEVALLIGVFVLSPFLQYRHDLYLEPHWCALTASIVLLHWRRFLWGAAAFGVSMGLYQLSWVLFPFLVLFAFHRGGWREASRTVLVAFLAMLAVVGPFLRSASGRIASNTVGQWSRLPHALADPINLSYWVTFLVRPDQLKWVQLLALSVLFGYCVLCGRCRTLTDMLRWMSWALALFIALNVLVDGYFYLTLLLLLLLYTAAVTNIWPQPETEADVSRTMGGESAGLRESRSHPVASCERLSRATASE